MVSSTTTDPSKDGSRRLRCLIEGECDIFSVTVERNIEVGDLKKIIQSERALTLKDVDPHNLELWKVNIDLRSHKDFLSQLKLANHEDKDKLESWVSILQYWTDQPPLDHLHIIMKAPIAALKRKRDDPIDISSDLFNLWRKPMKQDAQNIKEYLVKPLDSDWKIPLSHAEWKALLVSESVSAQHACTAKDLELLFKESEDETAVAILDLLKPAIMRELVNPSGTESSLHSFWDRNIRDILERCLGVGSIRDSNEGTETGQFRPNYGLLLADVCVFRGEEKRIGFSGMHPREELKVKTRWVYDPAPYILGYYAIGAIVVLMAVLPPGSQGGRLQVVDLISTGLSSRRERIKNASRMIKLCGVLRWLQQVIGVGKDRDMQLEYRDGHGGKSIEYFTSHVRKRYGLENGDDGKKRVEHLKAIYASLNSKGVPNTDWLKKAEIEHDVHGSYVDLEPRGIDEGPKSPSDVRAAVMCVLEALKVAHTDPPVFHRDIRWPNIVQSREEPSKWFLIDWEDASFAPTKAAPHLSHAEHSPNVYKDSHGADVDIWAVGRLIFTTQFRVEALTDLGYRMMDGHVLNAEQGLKEIRNLRATLSPRPSLQYHSAQMTTTNTLFT